MKAKLIAIVSFLFLAQLAWGARKPFIGWSSLHNPVLSYPDWSIKDFAVAYRNKVFYVFFSAFYEDGGQVRSHVVEVITPDFKSYSKPIMDFDGQDDGFTGMCSPDVQKLGRIWELSFNSWGGDRTKPPHQLFYMTSRDLIHWSPRHPIAANLTAGRGVDDLTVTRIPGGYYAMWKDSIHPNGLPVRLAEQKSQIPPWRYGLRPRLAEARSLSGPWHYVGPGYPILAMADGKENELIHENFEFIWIDGVLHVLASAYPEGHHAFLYALLDPDKPLAWGKGLKLDLPTESFNQLGPYDAGAIYDWRKYDGFFYLVYAGHNDRTSYAHRGWNRMALARSKDLVHWVAAGSGN
ncbi:MAG: hypothetical protein ACRD27_11905 [Terracidiphilus sp.]